MSNFCGVFSRSLLSCYYKHAAKRRGIIRSPLYYSTSILPLFRFMLHALSCIVAYVYRPHELHLNLLNCVKYVLKSPSVKKKLQSNEPYFVRFEDCKRQPFRDHSTMVGMSPELSLQQQHIMCN